MPSGIFDRFDVIVVPFPFSEKAGGKRRPALVLSNQEFNRSGHTVLAMVTTKGHYPWPGDCEIRDLEEAGLPLPCIIRPKLFTLDNTVILRRIGHLSDADASHVKKSIGPYLP